MPIKMKKVTVSPHMAEMWLAGMGANRHLREYHVLALLRDMEAGKWVDDGMPIRFNVKGQMFDGQHRCAALVRYGKPLEFWVCEGCEVESSYVADTGAPRSPADTITIAGVIMKKDWTSANLRAAIIRRLLVYDRAKDKSKTFTQSRAKQTLSRTELVDAAKKYSAEVNAAVPIAIAANRALRSGSAVFGALFTLFSRLDHKGAEEFFTRLISGEDLVKKSPIYALRQGMLIARLESRHQTETDIATRVIIAWNAWRNGEELQKIVVRGNSGLPGIE